MRAGPEDGQRAIAAATTMPRPMGGSRVGRVAFVGCCVALALATGVAPSGAAPGLPAPGWIVERATLEPLDGSPLGIEGVGEFRGSVEVARSPGGVAVINRVALDDYLRGISEVPSSWPIEAQKAQAIAARTYALWEMGRSVDTIYKSVGADICATQACQVYSGLAKERLAGSDAWNSAVESTRNQVLHYRGQPIAAKYSSSNGGRTVAGGQPYLREVDDPDDRYSPLNQWRAQFPLAEVGRALGVTGELIETRRDGDDVVLATVDLEGVAAEERLPVLDFRSRLNAMVEAPEGLPLAVPSARFGAATYEGQLVIDGRGWGHGIGLSQFGALGKALRGMKAPDILAAYYAGLRPVTVGDDRLPAEVKVAVALDRTRTEVVNPIGRFRVTSGDGTVLAHSASGRWTVTPAPGGRIRVVPPPEEAMSAVAPAVLVVEVADKATPESQLAAGAAVTRDAPPVDGVPRGTIELATGALLAVVIALTLSIGRPVRRQLH